MTLSRVDSLRALERAMLACFRAPFGAEHRTHPVFLAHVHEVVPLLDARVREEFAGVLDRAAAQYGNDAAAMGVSLAWLYSELRRAGEIP